MTEAYRMQNICKSCKLIDVVAMNQRPAYSVLRGEELSIFIDDPFAVISGLHEIERHNSNGISPKKVSVSKALDTSIKYEDLDISGIDSSTQPKNYIIAYSRKNIRAEEILNEYNLFLQILPERTFPYNIQFRKGNRIEMTELIKGLEKRNRRFLNFSDRIYVNEKDLEYESEDIINKLEPFCINYKVKL